MIIETERLSRHFGAKVALHDVSLSVESGEIRALLGPNGAGKTTLVRLLAGLVRPTSGRIRVAGQPIGGNERGLQRLIGLIPSGDRSFYLRISGLENLVFFARMQGLRRREAVVRSHELLELVGLAASAHEPVGVFSHGMQKRLSMARALLPDPPVLLVDEATHDLDPQGARQVRSLVSQAAERGAAVVWATQRLEEIRGFAGSATVLSEGRVRFAGSVAELIVRSAPRRFVVQIAQNGGPRVEQAGPALAAQLGSLGHIDAIDLDGGHFALTVAEQATLGDALAALGRAGVHVVACRDERPQVEEAFFSLVGGAAA